MKNHDTVKVLFVSEKCKTLKRYFSKDRFVTVYEKVLRVRGKCVIFFLEKKAIFLQAKSCQCCKITRKKSRKIEKKKS